MYQQAYRFWKHSRYGHSRRRVEQGVHRIREKVLFKLEKGIYPSILSTRRPQPYATAVGGCTSCRPSRVEAKIENVLKTLCDIEISLYLPALSTVLGKGEISLCLLAHSSLPSGRAGRGGSPFLPYNFVLTLRISKIRPNNSIISEWLKNSILNLNSKLFKIIYIYIHKC